MRIICVSEYAARGSGYTTILRGMLGEWERRGHEVTVLAFDYDGSEHPFKAALIPTDPQKIAVQWAYLKASFRPDALVVIFDLSLHHSLRSLQATGTPYIGIFPIEADPLIHPSEWTNMVDTMGAALCETQFGTDLLQAHGIRARYLPIGVDDFWRPPRDSERAAARVHWNLADKFVVLTVGDNQERKNFPSHCATIALLSGQKIEWPPKNGKQHQLGKGQITPNVHWILNTKVRPRHAGYTNFELVQRFNIADRTLILEHQKDQGLDREALRDLYWASDAFLLLSKAEGLGLPVLEAMATGVPVVGTDCTGIRESLHPDRGFLVHPEYTHIDPYHNQYRRWADPLKAANLLGNIARRIPRDVIARANRYARTFTWARTGDIFEEAMNECVRSNDVKHELTDKTEESGTTSREPVGAASE